jgi:proteasome lid subunit RPN8/RPN11
LPSPTLSSRSRAAAPKGGILLGKWEEGRLIISDYKPLDCEHACGPSFILSPRDRARLTELIASVKSLGEQVTGWYHSHTRSGIFLSEADLGIHNEFFPEPWQVALVLRPDTFLPTRAGFFFRDAGGTMRAESSCLEFTVEPLAPKTAPSKAAAAAVSLAGEVIVDAPSISKDPNPAPSQPPPNSTGVVAVERPPGFLDTKPPAPRR